MRGGGVEGPRQGLVVSTRVSLVVLTSVGESWGEYGGERGVGKCFVLGAFISYCLTGTVGTWCFTVEPSLGREGRSLGREVERDKHGPARRRASKWHDTWTRRRASPAAGGSLRTDTDPTNSHADRRPAGGICASFASRVRAAPASAHSSKKNACYDIAIQTAYGSPCPLGSSTRRKLGRRGYVRRYCMRPACRRDGHG